MGRFDSYEASFKNLCSIFQQLKTFPNFGLKQSFSFTPFSFRLSLLNIQPCRHKLRPTPSSTVSTAAAPQGAHSPLQPHTTTTPNYIPLQVLQPQRSPTAPQGVLLQLTTDQWGTQNTPLKPQITPQSPHAPQSSTSPL